MIKKYEEQVYAAVTGKVIGVYLGRPFEGWSKEKIAERWGKTAPAGAPGPIVRYVHADCGVPLIVPDDDISGTFIFIRALSDSGKFAHTPADFFGDTWLNYLWEKRTILWWGGMGNSTEHTAYLRLKHGVKSPRSGSIELNSREVAEQIGAQIFIDAFGMVAPGRPELAAKLAKMAASVSHDGEAVYAAMAVAAMVSAAFVEKDIFKVMDAGVSVIPADSLIARLHREVREWSAADGSWETTYDRIREKYGYHIFGGNCHVVPNHAVMVMAWAHGGGDFFKTMSIVASAGWDTDCNAANVGSVSALVAGLEHLNDGFDFRSPFADRIFLPNASGSGAVTDCLQVAAEISAIGRKIMGMPEAEPPKGGAYHHFSMPGSLHGYMAESGGAAVDNYRSQLRIRAGAGAARVFTPCGFDARKDNSPYAAIAAPWLYNGMTVIVSGVCCDDSGTGMTFRPAVKVAAGLSAADRETVTAPWRRLRSGEKFEIEWRLNTGERAITDFGFELESAAGCGVLIDSVRIGGRVQLHYPDCPLPLESGVCIGLGQDDVPGWITNADWLRTGFSNDVSDRILYVGKDDAPGVMVTGNRSWTDCAFSCELRIHCADRAGVLLRYQGMRRYYALLFLRDRMQLIRNFYGETVLAERPFPTEPNRLYRVDFKICGTALSAAVDSVTLLTADDGELTCGGAGIMVDTGLAGFRAVDIAADVRPVL
ncbi:MAG: ADP-ribosylglycohydrolase family protein [Victivallaceae bacterium]|nr:ADP-ribosylglycohydrolase family protein [Victivallaceae bacterium]